MCIIAAQPKGTRVDKATLLRCWNNNTNGGGFAYTDGVRVYAHKELRSFEKYYDAYTTALELFPNSAFIHHFRISTHGKVNETNCHPFIVNPDLIFAHNGIIHNAPLSDKYSDTYQFNEVILKQLPSDFLYHPVLVELVTKYIGTGSKLCFLDSANNITIINEQAGVWDAGVWYSNRGYKAYSYVDYGGTQIVTYPQAAKPKQSIHTPSLFSTQKPKREVLIKAPSKFVDIDWNKRLKTDKKIQSDIVYSTKPTKFDFGADYDACCTICDSPLYTYYERNNTFCRKCEREFEPIDRCPF